MAKTLISFPPDEETPDKAVEFFNNWVADVKETVPKERLLVFSVKEGWEPLCEFLQVFYLRSLSITCVGNGLGFWAKYLENFVLGYDIENIY